MANLNWTPSMELNLKCNGSCYQVGEKLVLQMTRRSTGSAAFGAGVICHLSFVGQLLADMTKERDLDLSEKDQVFVVETKPSFVAVQFKQM